MLLSIDDYAKMLSHDDDVEEEGWCSANTLMGRMRMDKMFANEAINWQTWTQFTSDPVFYDSEKKAFRVSRMLMLGVLLCGGSKEQKATVVYDTMLQG